PGYGLCCYLDSNHIDALWHPVTDLNSLWLVAYSAPGHDYSALYDSTGAYVSSDGGVLGLGYSGRWTQTQFNVFGRDSNSQAVFNSGTVLEVGTNVTDNAPASLSYQVGSTTAESNNLFLVPSSFCSSPDASQPSDFTHGPYSRFLESATLS